nr:reverse transcriptase domain-containing protein [Tanacetum cinerariifolium]
MMYEATPSKEINESGINKNKSPRFKQDVQENPHNDGVENKSLSIYERTTQPLVKPQQSSIPFLNRLKEACTVTMNEWCLAVLRNKLPAKEKDPGSFTIPCQVDKLVLPVDFVILEMPEDSRILIILERPFLAIARTMIDAFNKKITLRVGDDENPHIEVLTKRELADEFPDEHLMVLRSKFKDDEPWYADFVNYIVGNVVPPNWTFKKRKRFFLQVKTYLWEEPYAFKLYADNIMRRCVAGSETLKILVHCHLGPTGGHHSANVTAKKLNELAKLRDGAYENTRIYKERMKWHDSKLRGDKDFKVGDKVLLYNTYPKMYHGKLKSKWSGSNMYKRVYPYGAVEIIDMNGFRFKVNGQRLKKYYKGNIDKEDDEVIEFENGVT